MSNIAIKGATTGTGTFTIESPATNTDRTLTLPDEAGTVLTSASSIPATQLTGDVGSLVLIKTQTFSAVTSVNITDCFSADYRNYRVLIEFVPTNTAYPEIFMINTSDGTLETNPKYTVIEKGFDETGTDRSNYRNDNDRWNFGNSVAANGNLICDFTFRKPYEQEETFFHGTQIHERTDDALYIVAYVGGGLNTTSSYNGISIQRDVGTYTFTGRVSVYGFVE